MRSAFALAVLVSFSASAQALKTDDEKSLYTIGYVIASKNLQPLHLSAKELELVKRGLSDGASGKKAQVEPESQMEKLNTFAQARANAPSADSAKEQSSGKEFADNAAKEAGATKLPGGIVYKTLTPGTGASPAPTDKVKVNYEGRLTNGTVFDSSYKRNQPAEFGLNQVIKCWTEGVQKMKVGEKARLVCPSDTAYGNRGSPPNIPGVATLVFDVELLGINGK